MLVLQNKGFEVMHLCASGDFSVKKDHEVRIRHGCGEMMMNGLLLFASSTQNKLGNQEEIRCFNLSNKEPESCPTEGAAAADHLCLLSVGCCDPCCLVWITQRQ